MREAIGGAWLYYIFVVMIIFLVSFLAIFLNYMAAYRANNRVISILEQSEGIVPGNINEMINGNFSLGQNGDFKSCTISYGNKSFVIRVAAFMRLQIPLVNLPISVPVKNETRSINCYGDPGASGYKCPPDNVTSSLRTYLNYEAGADGNCPSNSGW